jgi:uncharacterized delta-60 repeat protein
MKNSPNFFPLTALLVVLMFLPLVHSVSAQLFYRPGTPDRTFGTAGIARTPLVGAGNEEWVKDALVQPDGKIVTAGFRAYQNSTKFQLNRYHANGMLDTGFGFGGIALTSFGGGNAKVLSIAIQPDGRILAAGRSNGDFALARYNTNGTLDQAFGTNGVVLSDFAGFAETAIDEAGKVFLNADGRIMVAGTAMVTPVGMDTRQGRLIIVRYEPDGTIDHLFGRRGSVVMPLPLGNYSLSSAVRSDDGSLFLTAYAIQSIYYGPGQSETSYDAVMFKFMPNGKPDRAFGQNGVVRDTTPEGNFNIVGILPTHQLLVTQRGALLRFNADGTFDSVVLPNQHIYINGETFLPRRYMVQSDGKLIVTGRVPSPPSTPFSVEIAIARLFPDGQPDVSFGYGGRTGPLPDDFSPSDQLLFLQPDGKVLNVSNAAYIPYRVLIARFIGDLPTAPGAAAKQ